MTLEQQKQIEREPPTLPDFRASLPSIDWTYADA